MVEKMRAQNKNKQINLKKEQAKNTVNWNSKSSKTFEKQSTRKSLKKNKPKFAENHIVGNSACSEDCMHKAYQLDERNCGQAVAAV